VCACEVKMGEGEGSIKVSVQEIRTKTENIKQYIRKGK